MGEQLSFLPPLQFCPIWPTKGTLADKALTMLMDGQQFDHPTFERLTGSWCARQPIADLRALGWPVKTIDVPSPTKLNPNRVIGIYSLDEKYIDLALAAQEGGHHGT
jgi:hypothetical protein